jgi:L-seryl-tRNA(Ser) seleniumtransferase
MNALRQLPSVERLVQLVEQEGLADQVARPLIVEATRAVLEASRSALLAGTRETAPTVESLLEAVRQHLRALEKPSLRPVINAGGVIIQTNLGRAPLSPAALAAMTTVGAGYSNLEYDLAAGSRGSRNSHLQALLCRISGAEAALVVNNNAAAIYLALIALAVGREVIVSRGQAVEIGGGFRIPDVLRQSGATLVEVGTTNRTYARDYAAAINEHTALLLRVHTSNFRLVGFVHETALADMAAVGHEYGVPLLDDLGSGTLLDTAPFGLAPEPKVQDSIAAGADLVAFSGDKLLGGPQAGILIGRSALIDRLRRHPLARALRVDKTTIAGLAATLDAYLREQALNEIPVWRMIAIPRSELQMRAERLIGRLSAAGYTVAMVACESAVGGGSLPGETLPSVALALLCGERSLDALAQRLREGEPAVVARIADGRLLFDLRTVLPDQDEALLERLLAER